MRRRLVKTIRLFGFQNMLHLPVKQMTVDEYCRNYFSTYISPKSIIYPATVLSYTPPVVIEKEISWKFSSLYQSVEAEAYVLTLDHARVVGENGAVITKENILLRDISREFGRLHDHSLMGKPFLRIPEKFQGTVAVLSTAGGSTYYHWLFDILPRLHLLQKAGLLNRIDKFIFPKIQFSFQKETLELLEIDQAKIVEADENFHLQADYLVVPSLPSPLGVVSKWASQFINHLADNTKDNSASSDIKIYISRRKASRSPLNEEELIAFLEGKGFTIVQAEDYTFAQQIALFRNATEVVSTHGSGLSNTVFCKPGTRVFDIFQSNFIVPCFWTLANNCNLQYYCIQTEEKDKLFFEPYWKGKVNATAFTVPIEKLKKFL